MIDVRTMWAAARPLAAAGLLALLGAAPPKAAHDPLEGYWGNTVVCASGARGNDLCHTWFERDGTFVNTDPTGMHRGHYTRGPMRADGKTPLCYHYDSDRMVVPAEAMGPPPGPPPGGKGGLICRTANFRTTCTRYSDDEGLDAADRARLKWSIVQRFHDGMCYPFPAGKKPGDSWYEEDDPLPSGNGIDRVFLLKGHR